MSLLLFSGFKDLSQFSRAEFRKDSIFILPQLLCSCIPHVFFFFFKSRASFLVNRRGYNPGIFLDFYAFGPFANSSFVFQRAIRLSNISLLDFSFVFVLYCNFCFSLFLVVFSFKCHNMNNSELCLLWTCSV